MGRSGAVEGVGCDEEGAEITSRRRSAGSVLGGGKIWYLPTSRGVMALETTPRLQARCL